MNLQVPVTPYVYKYLLKEYGSPPYHLALSNRNELRLAFQNLMQSAQVAPKIQNIPGRTITVILKEGLLCELATKYKSIIQSGYFYQNEFQIALRHFVEYQELIAIEQGLNTTEWNTRKAIESFLKHYGISELEYSLESAYRQFQRLKSRKKDYMWSLIVHKYGFSTTLKPTIKTKYKPAVITTKGQEGKVISFWCTSISSGKMVRKRMAIPKEVKQAGKDEEYAEHIIGTINNILMRGYALP